MRADIVAIMFTAFALNAGAAESGEADAETTSPEGYVNEAPLPDGFPPPSKLGEVVRKSYPLVRSFSAEGKQAFGLCFAYLLKNRHQMTAPVVMSYNKSRKGSDRFLPYDAGRMHFLLKRPALDQPKKDGKVTVSDMKKMQVVSIALQGKLSAQRVRTAEDRLRAYIDRHPKLKATGKPRLLGYNGPATPQSKRYWEIQIPVGSDR